ncbi:polysaccharide biosynthesis/export family protein [Algibacillus agarilyticus]|uniref:polysaccharide biosynthesis/export family protein n=1 Tax=Algibacillus agarilyticus TaxID=2234133 RepID=UPI000DCF7C58|nr:polysaccharide biosynthesis/export family protein [Algibacillus agarilyticus]
MSKFIFGVLSLVSFIVLSNDAINTDYTLGIGDTIQVVVYDEPDLTVALTIADDGEINFPFLGDVQVNGKTTRQVQSIITNGLKGDYLIKPSVQVSIVEYRPFYIHGEVKKPGAYAFQPGLNIDQAVALAGGFTERASEDKIFIKKDNGGETVTRKVTLTQSLSPGDTITIKQSFF